MSHKHLEMKKKNSVFPRVFMELLNRERSQEKQDVFKMSEKCNVGLMMVICVAERKLWVNHLKIS